MSPERGIDRKEQQNNSGERGLVFWKSLSLITMQEAERLGIPEGPVFVSPMIRGEYLCECGVVYSPIIYHKGLISAQHYHGHEDGGIYHYVAAKKDFGKILSVLGPKPNWIAIFDPVSFSMAPSLLTRAFIEIYSSILRSSEEVNLLQFRAFSANQELKEGFLVTDEIGINLFPSSNKDHPFITELGFKIIDGEIFFTKIPPPKATS